MTTHYSTTKVGTINNMVQITIIISVFIMQFIIIT